MGISGGAQRAGENYTLTCTVTGAGTVTTPTLQWLKNGLSVAGQTSATLFFNPLDESDSGMYICEARLNSITVRSDGVRITVVGM